MHNVPEITETFRSPVNISIQPFFKDHLFEGKTVLPAVEAMQILADSVNAGHPEIDTADMTDARFDKFLYILHGEKKIAAFCDIAVHENGDISAELLTKTTSRKAAITRVKMHARISFSRHTRKISPLPFSQTAVLKNSATRIDSRRIYRDLVPFGPAYRNIQDDILLSRDGAVATIHTPAGHGGTLGSPFTLDAALHAACVWGQRYTGIVAFPVGFKRRRIFKTTLPDATYISRITPLPAKGVVLVYDIWIYDPEGSAFEAVSGVQMRDVSAGRMKPPEWIVADK